MQYNIGPAPGPGAGSRRAAGGVHYITHTFVMQCNAMQCNTTQYNATQSVPHRGLQQDAEAGGQQAACIIPRHICSTI